MVAPYANTKPAPASDGLLYANNVLLPGAEGDLSNMGAQDQFDPVPVRFGAAAVASVLFTVQGAVGNDTSYVIMQGDFGTGNWFDLAWCTFTGSTGQNGLFLLSAGVAGANSFQQTRTLGTAPSPANGSNQCVLPGRIRFVGKGTFTASSSSSSARPASSAQPGIVSGVYVTIYLKLMGLR